ncbi:MAG: hypothetical protein FVQ79_12775, partial [Planctomycetes bacterium]|nr:hypothetical protein [Planctomycetota bacterium]
MQLNVIKYDGSTEEYMHTKVIGTFHNALALADESNVFIAEQLADAITFNLYKKGTHHITSEEIHLVIEAVLSATDYHEAAMALSEYRNTRKLRRNRIVVVNNDEPQSRWDKSIIVSGLVQKNGCDKHVARAIASSVEEKVLNLAMSKVTASLIEHLVHAYTETMLL